MGVFVPGQMDGPLSGVLAGQAVKDCLQVLVCLLDLLGLPVAHCLPLSDTISVGILCKRNTCTGGHQSQKQTVIWVMARNVQT